MRSIEDISEFTACKSYYMREIQATMTTESVHNETVVYMFMIYLCVY